MKAKQGGGSENAKYEPYWQEIDFLKISGRSYVVARRPTLILKKKKVITLAQIRPILTALRGNCAWKIPGYNLLVLQF